MEASLRVVADSNTEQGASLRSDAWRRLKRNRLAMAGLITLVLVGGAVVFLWGLYQYVK